MPRFYTAAAIFAALRLIQIHSGSRRLSMTHLLRQIYKQTVSPEQNALYKRETYSRKLGTSQSQPSVIHFLC